MNGESGSAARPQDGPAGVLLMRTWSDGEAALVRQLLSTYDIPCQVVSDVPHSILPLSVDGLGEVRIFVPPSRLADATSRVAEHLRQGLRMLPGGRSSGELVGPVETSPGDEGVAGGEWGA